MSEARHGSGCACFVDDVQTGSCEQAEAVCGEILGDGFAFAEVVACCDWVL